MMGRQTGDQSQLFYLFNLEERVPLGHLLRRINPIMTGVLSNVREKLAPFYSDIGRPSIDPELMIRSPPHDKVKRSDGARRVSCLRFTLSPSDASSAAHKAAVARGLCRLLQKDQAASVTGLRCARRSICFADRAPCFWSA
jgi:hypothetical protein